MRPSFEGGLRHCLQLCITRYCSERIDLFMADDLGIEQIHDSCVANKMINGRHRTIIDEPSKFAKKRWLDCATKPSQSPGAKGTNALAWHSIALLCLIKLRVVRNYEPMTR